MAVAVAVVGAVASVVGSAKAASAQRKSRALQLKQQGNERRRSTLQNLRQAQIARAQSQQGAVGAGSVGGSGFYGGIDSIGSRFADAAGFASQQSGLSSLITEQDQRASNWSGIAGFGSSLYGNANNIANIFAKPQQPVDLTR